MISSIHIRNFQSHKDTTLELVKGVNVIVGKPDSGKGDAGGKTAILRAINWCLKNRPLGEAFRSHWGGDTEIILDTGSDTIIRLKNKKDNKYSINGKDRKAMGQNPPEDILIALNMDDINIQSQHDNSFMLSKSPGEAAQYLNSMVRLDIISSSLSNIGKMGRDVLNDITFISTKIEETKTKLVEFEGLDKIEKIVVNIEKLERQIKGLRDNEMSLRNLLNDIDEIETELDELRETDKAKQLVDNLIKLAEKTEKFAGERDELETLLSDIDKAESALWNAEDDLKTLNEQHDKLMPKEGICPVCNQRIKKK